MNLRREFRPGDRVRDEDGYVCTVLTNEFPTRDGRRVVLHSAHHDALACMFRVDQLTLLPERRTFTVVVEGDRNDLPDAEDVRYAIKRDASDVTVTVTETTEAQP